uniref:Uncharacterized protein n=4 Tax=unclassified Prevotella TaxID=2638335 RepID=A0AB33JGX0_9BACT
MVLALASDNRLPVWLRKICSVLAIAFCPESLMTPMAPPVEVASAQMVEWSDNGFNVFCSIN